MATPPPMPHPNDDRDHIAARASKQEFTDAAKQVRSNANFSARYKAQQVAGLYEKHVTETASAYQRITARRRARLAHLESQVPIGPGIPDGTTAADKAVLMTAFRTAMDKARDTDRSGRARLLAEAERFDDDAMRRAVLTHAMDTGEVDTVKRWADLHADSAGLLDETAALRDTLAGRGTGHLWDAQDFNPLPKPHEAYEWARIEGDPNAQPDGVNGRTIRPGVVDYGPARP